MNELRERLFRDDETAKAEPVIAWVSMKLPGFPQFPAAYSFLR